MDISHGFREINRKIDEPRQIKDIISSIRGLTASAYKLTNHGSERRVQLPADLEKRSKKDLLGMEKNLIDEIKSLKSVIEKERPIRKASVLEELHMG